MAVPYSQEYDDVYFHERGIEESEYVFLESSDLKARWANVSPNQHFCVGELGFGTGLNFLLTWKLWKDLQELQDNSLPLKRNRGLAIPERAILERNATIDKHLIYVSIEKSPLSMEDLCTAQGAWPELLQWSTVLLEHYPSLEGGVHPISISENTTLILIWEDCKEALLSWRKSSERSSYAHLPRTVDAWYLDGFTPSKNPSMWEKELYQRMAELSVWGSTVATFTSAGHVKRGLEEFGYTVAKKKGFGGKRDMISAVYQG